MRLSQALSQRCTIEVPFNGEKLKVTYKPGVYTPKFQSEADKAAETEDSDRLSIMLSRLIESWDLTDDAGSAVATDKESLRALPIKILSGVMIGILKDMNPNNETSANTAGG